MNTIQLEARFIHDLHAQWKLYPMQVAVAKAVLVDGKRFVVTRWGRKASKSTTGLYTIVRAACTRPKHIYFWFAPKAKQAKEIVWRSGRLQNFVDKKYIKKIRDDEMRITFYNDSFIKLDGSDEYEQYRGTECDGAFYDEIKDMDARFDPAFRPNLGPRHGWLLAAGSPPRNILTESEKQFKQWEDEARSRSDGYFTTVPSWARTDPDWLAELKIIKAEFERRYAAGDLDALNEWNSEYGAEWILGGPGSIFPMFSESRHCRPRQELLDEIRKNIDQWDFYCVADPGTKHAFAVTFWAVNPYRALAYCLAEIHETDQSENVISKIYPRIMKVVEDLKVAGPHVWNYIYDEAAAYWRSNVQNDYPDSFFRPTRKALYRAAANDVKAGLQLFKDGLTNDCIVIASECEKFIWEIKSYKRDQNGNIPKENDDCLDTGRYALCESNFRVGKESIESNEEDPDRARDFTSYRALDEGDQEIEAQGLSEMPGMDIISGEW